MAKIPQFQTHSKNTFKFQNFKERSLLKTVPKNYAAGKSMAHYYHNMFHQRHLLEGHFEICSNQGVNQSNQKLSNLEISQMPKNFHHSHPPKMGDKNNYFLENLLSKITTVQAIHTNNLL